MQFKSHNKKVTGSSIFAKLPIVFLAKFFWGKFGLFCPYILIFLESHNLNVRSTSKKVLKISKNRKITTTTKTFYSQVFFRTNSFAKITEPVTFLLFEGEIGFKIQKCFFKI